jgi:hypothetical protein
MVLAAVSWFAFSVGTALLREFSGFSGPVPQSAVAFGVTTEKGNEEQGKQAKSSQLQTENWTEVRKERAYTTYNPMRLPTPLIAQTRTHAHP